MRNAITIIGLTLLTLLFGPVPRVSAVERLCDPAFEDCRAPLLDLIRAEMVGIDVAFWFMEDTRYASEIIRRWQAGVPVRVLMDSEANAAYEINASILESMRAAGIPMREKTTGGILHWKMMLFEGQNTVEFSGANFSPNAFVPNTPYVDYVDETIYFADDPIVVNSFKTKYDDHWTATTGFADYANITAPPTRKYEIYPIDPELNFPPGTGLDFATRSVKRYNAETVRIDAMMYRITDKRHTDALIAAHNRGVPVRLLTEPMQYREPTRLWHSWNVDRLYMAGIEVRHRKHAGLSHEKSTLLYGQGLTIFGSSNWTSPSANSQAEHNYFTTKAWFFDWSRQHFERKWFNTAGFEETEPFVPLPPDPPVYSSPANGAANQPVSIQLKWHGGFWAHKYDVYFGDTPDPPLIAADLELGPSETASKFKTYVLPLPLDIGKVYYWKIVSKTMANLTKAGPVWSFRTMGEPPTGGPGDVVLYAWKARVRVGNWILTTDPSAAGGAMLQNKNVNATKVPAPMHTPVDYFDMKFIAQAGVPYRLWIRGKAEKNSYNNDSVYVQFNDSVSAAGAPMWQMNTTSGATVTLEDCTSCGVSGWGWNDTATGAGVLGPVVYFASTGVHTLRVQNREDGLGIDQIVLSRAKYMNVSPGTTKSDGTVLVENGGAEDDSILPQTSAQEVVMHAASAMTVRGKWQFVADATAANGYRLWNPNANVSRPPTPIAAPANYFEIPFRAVVGVPYHLWIRARAEGDLTSNDSVYVQFTGSVDAAGNPMWRMGTTDGASVIVEDGTGGVQGWGWADGGFGILGPDVYFNTEGWHTVRVQVREDGISIDQIVLSPSVYATTSPGATKNDTTILTETESNAGDVQGMPGGDPPPPPPPPPPPDPTATDIVLHMTSVTTVAAGAWTIVDDFEAASGKAAVLPDAARAKVSAPAANPSTGYIELSFDAKAYTPYRLWLRGKATANSAGNDSVHVQFTDSMDAAGNAAWRIGSTTGMEVNIEDCSGCGVSGWGWEDNGWGTETTLGPTVRFTTAGVKTIRIQNREDGLYIDQIVLSPNTYLNAAPGLNQDDATILPPTQP